MLIGLGVWKHDDQNRGNLVSWSTKKQPTIACLSCESEYQAMAKTAAEIIWIAHLLQ
jgi:hypothetical protein